MQKHCKVAVLKESPQCYLAITRTDLSEERGFLRPPSFSTNKSRPRLGSPVCCNNTELMGSVQAIVSELTLIFSVSCGSIGCVF